MWHLTKRSKNLDLQFSAHDVVVKFEKEYIIKLRQPSV